MPDFGALHPSFRAECSPVGGFGIGQVVGTAFLNAQSSHYGGQINFGSSLPKDLNQPARRTQHNDIAVRHTGEFRHILVVGGDCGESNVFTAGSVNGGEGGVVFEFLGSHSPELLLRSEFHVQSAKDPIHHHFRRLVAVHLLCDLADVEGVAAAIQILFSGEP